MRLAKYQDAFIRQTSFHPLRLLGKIFNLLLYQAAPRTVWCRSAPMTVQIEHTSKCNLHCPMCVRENFAVGEMSLADFRRLIGQLRGTLKIHLQGNGEPFLHPQVFEMIRAAVTQNMLVSVVTNGTLLDARRIPRLVRSRLHEICISVDGPDRESFEAIRVGAHFDRVREGIRNLSAAIRESRARTTLILFVTLMRSNLRRLPEFVRFAADVSVPRIFFQRVQTKDDFLGYYTETFKKAGEFVSFDEVAEAVRGAESLAAKLGISLIHEEKGTGCLWPWWGAYITWRGDVTPCCMAFDPAVLPLGNVFETPFREIWNGPNYQRLRQSILQRKALPLCQGCRFF